MHDIDEEHWVNARLLAEGKVMQPPVAPKSDTVFGTKSFDGGLITPGAGTGGTGPAGGSTAGVDRPLALLGIPTAAATHSPSATRGTLGEKQAVSS